jgi:hypothetical protein
LEIREDAQLVQLQLKGRHALAGLSHRPSYLRHPVSGDIAQKLEGEMNARWIDPPHKRRLLRFEAALQMAKSGLNCVGKLDGNENTKLFHDLN